MKEKKTPNFVSPIIYVLTVAMAVFITHLLIRAATGAGVFEPGLISASLLAFLGIFFGGVWCTVFYIGYQLQKISDNE